MDGSRLFKDLLQGTKATDPLNCETLPSAGSRCDEGVSDLIADDANKQTDVPEQIPAKAAACDEAQPAGALSIDSAHAIPEIPDASLVKTNVPYGLPRHAEGKKLSISNSNKSPHTKKCRSGEEQVETKAVVNNFPLVASTNIGTDAPVIAVQQSILLHRVAPHVERNDANASKATPVAIPVGNAKEYQPPSMNMSAGTSDKVPDLVFPGSREFSVDVEAGTHDMEPVPSAILHHGLPATVSVPMSDAAIFRPFLLQSDRHTEVVMRPENDMAAIGLEVSNQTVTAQPIKRLELQWNDSSLGKVSLTAELRDGALHAVVDNSRAATGVDATDLHRFLEDNHVPMHALQVNGQPTVSQASRNSSWSSAATDVGAGMGGSQSFSHGGQGREGSSAREQRRTLSKAGGYEGAMQIVEGRIVVSKRQSDQRLSIHI